MLEGMARKLNFARARGLFVTSTDTGVGKTLTAGAIARQLVTGGLRVGVFKPIATGCRRDREGLVSADAEFLAHCSKSECTLEQINPVRYAEPLAPLVAAERCGRAVDWGQMVRSYGEVCAGADVVIAEGIGGVLVPIERDYMVADLMAEMGLAALVVARSGLGTLNHTLLTLESCRARGIRIAGVVINEYQADDGDLAEESNPRVLAEVGKVEVLSVIPYDGHSSVEKGQLGAGVLGAVKLVNWAEQIERLSGGQRR